jgi:hypothetical protein
MATQVQFRRGTTAQIAAFTGAQAEVVVDTTKETCVVCDGSTPGGFPLLREDGINSALSPGSLNNCALKFANNTGTGLISPSTGTLALVANGIQGLSVTGSGDVVAPNDVLLMGDLSIRCPATTYPPSYKTTNFTVDPATPQYICNGTSTITVVLPNAATYTGLEIRFTTIANYFVVSASSNVIPIEGGSPGSAILRASAGDWITLISNGLNWVTTSSATLTSSQTFTQSGTGAVTRSLTSKLSELVSVKDFGAVGDGIVNDTAAIQAAATAASARKASLFFPEGTYAIYNTISVGANCSGLLGSGHGTILVATGGEFVSYSPLVFVNSNTSGLTIRDLKVKIPVSTHPLIQGIQLQSCTSAFVSNLIFEEAGYTGVYLAACQNVTVSDCLVASTAFRGIRVESVGITNSNRITIRNFNIVNYCPSMPISIIGGEGHLVTGCKVTRYSTTNFGISFKNVSNSQITNNYIITDTTEGINCEDCSSIKIQGNQVECLTGHTDMGISIFGATSGITRCTVIDNTVKNSGGAGIGVASTPTTGPANHNLVANNTIISPNQLNSANPWGGVLLYGGINCNFNTVQNNKVLDLVGYVKYGVSEWDNSAGTPDSNQLLDNFTAPAAGLLSLTRLIGTNSIASDLLPIAMSLPVTASSGTITTATATGTYQRRGKYVFVSITVSITNNGTGTGTLILGSFPFLNFAGTLNGRENNVLGKQVVAIAGVGALAVRTYDNLYPGATNASITLSGVLVLP